jgi:hypothetical protein
MTRDQWPVQKRRKEEGIKWYFCISWMDGLGKGKKEKIQ